MAAEAPRPSGEQLAVDPVQAARGAFNKSLFGGEYDGGALLGKTVQLQNALLGSQQLTPEKIFHELTIVSGQAADRAELQQDADTASTLREMQAGFQLTYENFRPQPQVAAQAPRPAEPTRSEALVPMTGAKGEQEPAKQSTRTKKAKPEAHTQAPTAEPEAPEGGQQASPAPEGQASTPEAQAPQNPPKRRGRPPKNPQ